MSRLGGLLAVTLSACSAPRSAVSPSVTLRSAAPEAQSRGTPAAPGRYGLEPDAHPTPFEARALDSIRDRLTRGGEGPRTSPALVLAARELARRAAGGEQDPISRAHLRGALSRALSYDAGPAVGLVSGAPDVVLKALAGVLPDTRVTHIGAGGVERDGVIFLVLLAAERRLELAPYPRDIAPGTKATLAGKLGSGLLHPRVFVALPTGEVREVDVAGGNGFRARIAFPNAGRYVVEIVATGQGGPEVAGLFAVSAGGASLDVPEVALPADPEGEAAVEARVLEVINSTRRHHALPQVEADPILARIARRHSERMLELGHLAHVLPGAGDLSERLRREHVAYRRTFENVAKGQTALAAHAAAEESPLHLGNLLSPGARRVGVGIARGRLASGDAVVYLTEILVEPVDDGADSPLTPGARVREALWRERARAGSQPLTADVRLDDLALAAAQAMRDRGEPDPGDLSDRALALGRSLAAVDAFVASAPAEATRSANLRDVRFHRVGVGVAIGDSPRFGAGRLFIAVVYTD